jgi:hypothetical protein
MPGQLLQGRILHVSGTINAAYNDFETMPVGQIQNPGGTLSGEDDGGDCSFGAARFSQR